MKKILNPAWLPVFSILAGVVAMLLRFWQLAVGVDEKGLLISGHASVYMIFGLLIFSVVIMVLLCRKMPTTWTSGFTGSVWAGSCAFVSAMGLLAADIIEFIHGNDMIVTVNFLLGILAAGALVWMGLCRLSGVKAGIISHSLLSIYFMLHLIVQYRLWSAEPQLLVYCFPLLASVCLMLSCYHRAELSITGKRVRRFLFLNQLSLLLCCMSLGESLLFYGSMALWTASDLFFAQRKDEKA